MNEQNAEQFLDLVLEKLIAGEADLKSILAHQPELANQIRPHLEAATWLAEHSKRLSSAARFSQRSWLRVRSRILNQEKRSPRWLNIIPMRLQSLPGGFLFPLTIALLLLATIVGTGIAYAAQDALPNDTLYEVKLSLENAQLTLTLSDEGQAKVLTTMATKRLHEAYWATQANRMDESLIAMQSYTTTMDDLLLQLTRLSPTQFLRILSHLEENLSLQEPFFDALQSAFASALSLHVDRTQQVLQAAQMQFFALQSLVDHFRSDSSQGATPTVTPSPEGVIATATVTPSPTGAAIASPTVTASPTADPIASPTVTPSPEGMIATATVPPTHTPDPIASPTGTPSHTPDPVASPTVTPSHTPGPSATPTLAPSHTAGPSATPSITPSPTP